ncbi:uncharacterized protein LOC121739010 isoform X2 [Aricia agestis]|uniref:uncharacterized protein LOC121739010 isoform X2 n=1 Tax=Aricia agestis TaxID=91739 RepID=UPI001C20AC01|nr:uncharacterized protein LOC121739010 isoform X2 [Aricia agestis]
MALPPEIETSTDTRSVLHIVEENFIKLGLGSEDTIHRHLRFLFSHEVKWIEKNKEKVEHAAYIQRLATPENSSQAQEETDWNMFRRLKLLMVYHSIKTLFFKDWYAVMADPPTLISKLEVNGPLSEHMEQLRVCLDKLHRLGEITRYHDKLTLEVLLAADPKMESLPEVDLLDYLLASPHLLDLRAVARMHRRVDHYTFYFEKVWPLPTQYTPRLLYKLKIDDTFVEPLPLMSWEITKETVEEEEREGMSTASD